MLETMTERLAAEIEAKQRAILKRSCHAGEFTAANVRERLTICESCPAFLGNTCSQGEPCQCCAGAEPMDPTAFATRVAIQQWECPDRRWPSVTEGKTDAA